MLSLSVRTVTGLPCSTSRSAVFGTYVAGPPISGGKIGVTMRIFGTTLTASYITAHSAVIFRASEYEPGFQLESLRQVPDCLLQGRRQIKDENVGNHEGKRLNTEKRLAV